MSGITAEMVKKLREATGAGMMDCKNALGEAGGDFDKAIEVLRKKGLKDVSKRAGKVAAEGCIGVYIHHGDQVGALVELNCETDFVARGEDFKELARNIAMQVVARSPLYLSREEVPQQVIEKEKEICLASLTEAQRKNADKILPGKLEKFYEENCLVDQSYLKDDSMKISQLLQEATLKTGEKVVVRRFQRFEVGEGIEKTVSNIAEDVAALTSGVQ